MNNDLISRKALKEKAETVTLWNGDVRRFVSYETIDNAPTVEDTHIVTASNFSMEQYRIDLQGAYDCGYAKGLKERPQGEWKFSQGITTQGSLKCPFCDYRDYHNTNSNYCPNCGAQMQKGGAE